MLALTGCMSAGTAVDPNAVARFERGRTTYGEVVGQLGTPNADVLAGDGSRVVVYTYTQARARPESFIPIVGPLVGGADATTTGYQFNFDSSGVLVGLGNTTGQASVGAFRSNYTGATAQAAAPALSSTPQPPPSSSGSRRICTEAEAAQKRIAVENGYTMIPNCQ
jgi:hypothetical protein